MEITDYELEGNILISKYLVLNNPDKDIKWGINDVFSEPYIEEYIHFKEGNAFVTESRALHFHDSYDYIMGVVDKIESDHTLDVDIIIYKGCTQIKIWNGDYFEYNKTYKSATSKVYHIFIAVVEFLKWLNENK